MDIESQEIINHALSSKENLHIAVAVGKTYNELREFLIREFSKHLEQKLKEKEWETDFLWWNKKPFGKKTGFMCRKDNWPDCMKIKIESLSGENYYYIGIYDGVNNSVDSVRNEIFNKCNDVVNHGEKDTDWIWWKLLSDEYQNFDNADTLFALHEKEKFAAYLLAEIEKLGVVVDSELVKINPLY